MKADFLTEHAVHKTTPIGVHRICIHKDSQTYLWLTSYCIFDLSSVGLLSLVTFTIPSQCKKSKLKRCMIHLDIKVCSGVLSSFCSFGKLESTDHSIDLMDALSYAGLREEGGLWWNLSHLSKRNRWERQRRFSGVGNPSCTTNYFTYDWNPTACTVEIMNTRSVFYA